MTLSILFYPNLRCHENDDMTLLIAHHYFDNCQELCLKKSNKHLRHSKLYHIDRKFLFFNEYTNDYLIFFSIFLVRKKRERKKDTPATKVYIEQMLDHSTFN